MPRELFEPQSNRSPRLTHQFYSTAHQRLSSQLGNRLRSIAIKTGIAVWGISALITAEAQQPVPADPRIQEYQSHRLAFEQALTSQEMQFKAEADSLQQEVDQARLALENEEADLRRIRSHLESAQLANIGIRTVYSGMVHAIFPPLLALSSGWVNKAPFWFALTAINLFLVLIFLKPQEYQRHKKWVIWSCAILVTFFSAAALAQGQDPKQEVIERLSTVNALLGQSDHQRYIAILEAGQEQTINLPNLSSGDPNLNVYPTVTRGSAEYHFSLAALYTHEAMGGKAVDAIKNLSSPGVSFSTNTRDHIVVKSLQFLISQSQSEAASNLMDRHIAQLGNVELLLELSEFLESQGMSSASEKALAQATLKANTVGGLLQLTRYFNDKGEPDQATNALSKAVQLVSNSAELHSALKLAIELKRDSLVIQIVDVRLKQVVPSFSEQLPVLDLLLQSGRREEAVRLIGNAIDSAIKSASVAVPLLAQIVHESLNRNLPEQALKATTMLALFLGTEGALNYPMQVPNSIKPSKEIDAPDGYVNLPVFSGLIHESVGFKDKAEIDYIRAVLGSLDKIAKSYGYDLSGSLSSYQLLGRLWEAGDQAELLAALDPVFTKLEEHRLEALRKANAANLASLRETQAELASEATRIAREKTALQAEIATEEKNSARNILKLIACIVFILAAAVVAAWRAYLYAMPSQLQRTYGAFGKFIESLGWISLLSVLSLLSGLILVIVSQFLLLFHRTAENTHRMHFRHVGLADEATIQQVPGS